MLFIVLVALQVAIVRSGRMRSDNVTLNVTVVINVVPNLALVHAGYIG